MAEDRKSPGHWEADLMLFSKYGQAVLALHERYSRLLIATRPLTKEAIPIAMAMKEILAPLPPEWRQTITFDNGTEFARHYELHDLDMERSSAIRTRHGRKVALRMRSDGCDECYLERRIL